MNNESINCFFVNVQVQKLTDNDVAWKVKIILSLVKCQFKGFSLVLLLNEEYLS